MAAPSSPGPPLTIEAVREWAARVAGFITSVEPLAGDASTRRFYRVRRSRGDTLVAMVLDRPIDDPASDPQFAVGSYLETLGFPVPHLETAVPEVGLLLYEDLGDVLLEGLALGEPAAALDRHYAEAVRLILLLQGPGTLNLPPTHPSARSALDRARFTFELEFFRENYLVKLRGLTLGVREERVLGEFFETLAGAAAAPPLVLCHRDYHSRNLLVKDGRIRVVDFQDARMGPIAYDLASLLRDSYVPVPADRRDRLIETYLQGAAVPPGGPAFQELFDTAALQRNLKAIGTFAYQSVALGRHRYLASIPPTWEYVFDGLARLPAFADARPVLELAAGA